MQKKKTYIAIIKTIVNYEIKYLITTGWFEGKTYGLKTKIWCHVYGKWTFEKKSCGIGKINLTANLLILITETKILKIIHTKTKITEKGHRKNGHNKSYWGAFG